MLSWSEVQRQIIEAQETDDSETRVELAASISRFAAKAEDDSLLLLSEKTPVFVGWMCDDHSTGVVLHAYAACIVANIAFLPEGQRSLCACGDAVAQIVKRVEGISKSMSKEEQRVVVHCTAALQNITYKNPDGCETVIHAGGEKILRKALKKAPVDKENNGMQQYISGALANLGLYRKGSNGDDGGSKPSGLGKFFGGGRNNKGSRGGGGGGGGSGAAAASAHASPPNSSSSSSPHEVTGGGRLTPEELTPDKSEGGGGYGGGGYDQDEQGEGGGWQQQQAERGMQRQRGYGDTNSVVSSARAEANYGGALGAVEVGSPNRLRPLQGAGRMGIASMGPGGGLGGGLGGGAPLPPSARGANPWGEEPSGNGGYGGGGYGGGGGGYPSGGMGAAQMRRPQRLAPINGQGKSISALPPIGGSPQSLGGLAR